MPLPTFIIIGVQKAGTTSIYHYLGQHPQVYMSPVKEPHFLERDWPHLATTDPEITQPRINTWEKYQALFDGVTDETAIGEASVNCLFHYEQSIDLIKKYVPNAQVVAVLRHPAERAYSDYLMHIRDYINTADQQPLSEHIAQRSQTSYVIRKGYYAEGVAAFQKAFGPDRVKIFLHDDLKTSASQLMAEMYRFIGVDDTFQPEVTRKAQAAKVPKNKTVNALLQGKNPVRSAIASTLKLVLPTDARQRLRSGLINLNSGGKDDAPFLPEDRAALLNLYREDVLKLQDLLQRDLSTWLV
ncbi:MAG: sulfotransferase [Leptolyngbya sp.]|nr:sulfotransferase [Leptolyngbya sp.]